jgi:hypothetical protein
MVPPGVVALLGGAPPSALEGSKVVGRSLVLRGVVHIVVVGRERRPVVEHGLSGPRQGVGVLGLLRLERGLLVGSLFSDHSVSWRALMNMT